MALFARTPAARGQPPEEHAVLGERGAPLIARAWSLQSRVSNLLAMALMLAIGVAFLAWYYTHAAARPALMRQSAQAKLASRAQAEMPLPSLGPLPSPPSALAGTEVAPSAVVDSASPAAASALPPMPASTAASTVRPSALERRLSGAAFATVTGPAIAADTGLAAVTAVDQPSVPQAMPTISPRRLVALPGNGPDGLSTLLNTETAAAARARVLPAQRLLLPKGAFIDCTLETAIDSSLPGLTTCVTATDTFGADGAVVLLDRGTKLTGETRGQVQQGMARLFVLWTEARTPGGVVVPLDSPGADELGRSGLPGEVNRHFWQRFGAAILISTIDGAVQAGVQSASKGSGTVIYNPSASQDVTTEVLKSTLSIAPTVAKNNGDRIQVLVARDVDFSSVYELRRAVSSP
ncbi:MAG TPA: type IV secretion system protein VirB10 [Steroidobacteraceae bacterium]|jgi:type IV secretion system protein VirB10|nr:type IV secretion system protein VirB10 [Steroidobacteraceae bacterium]